MGLTGGLQRSNKRCSRAAAIHRSACAGLGMLWVCKAVSVVGPRRANIFHSLPTARRFGYDNSLQLNEQLLSRVSFEHAADQVRPALCVRDAPALASLQESGRQPCAARCICCCAVDTQWRIAGPGGADLLPCYPSAICLAMLTRLHPPPSLCAQVVELTPAGRAFFAAKFKVG